MIRRLLSRLSRRPSDIRREVTVLITLYGPEGAWLEARSRWRVARGDARWRGSQLLRRRGRHWKGVMREIERQTGFRHDTDTTKRADER
ncbi:hypothetical protein [Aurantimonas endophytica]|uniref:Uncharacterized protein n=1 Tax=Aurantimonas endophytica TaxID=1522175 RepID=A0A7W6HEY2_9HYPH|nr:hypothetical protein [Aurantimonas endophytica]MBB4003847.1 hypothetical protein [Aurantimonas endophytica]MCO6404698.1 hypothetical protein [Aurantimonas endophytica]